MPFGESTLALLLSVIALAAVFIPDPRAPLKEISDYLSGTNFSMGPILVELNIDNASVLMENNDNSTIAVNHLSCSLDLPLDLRARINEELRGNYTDDVLKRRLTVSETMGVFLVTFDLEKPVLVRPYEVAVITLSAAHISPPLQLAQARKASDTVTNYCFLSGTSFENEIAVGAFTITPRQLIDIDLLDVIRIADYGEQREHERESDMALVRDIRAEAREAESKAGSP